MANENGFTEAQQHELQASLISALEKDQRAKDIFCQFWEGTKTVLQFLLTLPIPPIAKTVINGIIIAGDAAYKLLKCNQ